jgi:hypothetical protein
MEAGEMKRRMKLERIWVQCGRTKKYGCDLPGFIKKAEKEGYTLHEAKSFYLKKFRI